jgi:tetratricopeptide (TPR) repeat protein
MVLDNADDYNSIASWIPKEGGAVLITTREPSPGTMRPEQIIPVPLLEPEEAITWLYQLSKRNKENLSAQEQAVAKQLVDDLGYLPLAIAQAAAYLREQSQISIAEYQTRFMTLLSDTTLVSQETSQHTQNDPDKRSRKVVASTWMLSLKAIEVYASSHSMPNIAKDLLAIFVYYAPKDIPLVLAEECLNRICNISPYMVSYVLDEYMGQLVSYTLLERNALDSKISIHRLLQLIIRDQLCSTSQDVEYLRKSILCLLDSYPYGEERERNTHIQLKRELLSHLQAMIRNHDVYSNKLTEKIDRHHLEYAFAYISDAYNHLGDVQKLVQILVQALNLEETLYGKAHPRVASILNNLGNAHGALGDTQESIKLFKHAFNIYDKYYGNDYYQIANVLTNLGNAYGALGDEQKQKEFLERALTIKENYYGKDHYQVATTLASLANCYGDLGDAHKKKKLLERCFTIFEKHYGKNHYKVASILMSLGTAYATLGDAQNSKDILKCALTIDEKHYGKDHYQVSIILTTLANTYGALGDAHKKKELLERALDIKLKHYGNSHPEVAITLISLGNAYGDLGNANKQKELLECALIIFEKHYGKDHDQVAITLMNLGNAYGDLGDAHRQKELLERALCISKQYSGKDNIQTGSILANLGNAYLALGEAQKSRETLEHALLISEQFYSKEHYKVAII